MEIRRYKISDITTIQKLGCLLHNNYNFKLDTFSYCFVIEKKII